jgi:hypothetical protein
MIIIISIIMAACLNRLLEPDVCAFTI